MGQIATLIKGNVSIHFQNEPLESAWEIFPGPSAWRTHREDDLLPGSLTAGRNGLLIPQSATHIPSSAEQSPASRKGLGGGVAASFFGPLRSGLKDFYLTY